MRTNPGGLPVLLALVVAAKLLLGGPPARGETTSPFSKTPWLQMPAPSTAVIMWESSLKVPGTVSWGSCGNLDQEFTDVRERIVHSAERVAVTKATSWKTNTYYLYEATLSNLHPGSNYSYSVEFGGVATPQRDFKMLDPHAPSTRFIVYGDSRTNPNKHRMLVDNFLAYSPEFILHTGDLAERGRDYPLWGREFFSPMSGVIDRVPIFPVIGNHEQDGANYLNYFNLPGNELWYSFDSGPVHFLALDFRQEKGTQEQFKFARKDLLASNAPWKIVFLHEPMFNIGGHASKWGHKDYLPLFQKARVDLVLAGHSHLYERFWPLVSKHQPGQAITAIITGGGGAPLHRGFDHPALAARETTNHFMVFQVDEQRLRGEARRINGSVIDAFEIAKSGGRLSAEYLAHTYSQETLELFHEFRMAGKVNKLPSSDGAAQLALQIPPRTRRKGAARIQFALAPESAKTYQLLSPEDALITSGSSKAKEFSLQVMSVAGVKVSTNSDLTLTPPLVLQATVSAAEGQTLVFSDPVKVSP